MKHIVRMVVIAALVAVAAGSAWSEEALFDTETASIHKEKGLAHLRAKRIDAAIAEFEAAAEAAPEAEAFYYLGYAYYLKGRNNDVESRELSRENFEKAYEIDPNFTPTRLKPAEPVPPAAQSSSKP